MKIVIQCAGSKYEGAESFSLQDGRKVIFVASPPVKPSPESIVYARPDDMAETSHETWREKIFKYNIEKSDKNPINLLPAYKLYKNPIYRQLVSRFRKDKIFILSAGWGLIPAYFLTPVYDITFSSSADILNRRKSKDLYKDFCLMGNDDEEIVFLGGKSYLPLFHALTKEMLGRKIIFYNSKTPPDLPPSNIKLIKFETPTRTNWHYECAQALIESKITYLTE